MDGPICNTAPHPSRERPASASSQMGERLQVASESRKIARWMCRQVRTGLCVSLLLHASASLAAEEPPLNLVWTAPRKCPQYTEVTTRIGELVGPAQGNKVVDLLSARGVIESTSSEFQLTLLIQDGSTTGSRTITSASCRSLSDAAAVVLSLLIRQRRELGRALSNEELGGSDGLEQGTATDRSRIDSRTDPSNASQPAIPGAATSQPAASLPVAPAPSHEVARDGQTPDKNLTVSPSEPERSLMFLLAAPVAQLEFATLPKVSTGAGFALGVAHRRWQFFASAALFQSQTKRVSDRRVYDATFLNTSVSAWGCGLWGIAPFQLAPCVVVAINRIEASTASVANGMSSYTRTVALPSMGAGVKAALQFNRTLALFVRTSLRVHFSRPEFVFADALWGQQGIHRVSEGSLELSLGCEWGL